MIMNRSSSKNSLIGNGGRNLHSNGIHHNAPITHRRSMSYTNNTDDFNNNNVDLFSRNRHSLSAASSDESDLQVRLGRLSFGSTKPAKSVLDDLLSSNEGGKHDYDWLLTPPGTPLLLSSDGKESQPTSVAPRRNSSVRSGSTIKTSRLSVSQSESNHPSRPARSSSATRPSISTTQYTNYSNRNSNILNTSSSSISSYIRPSTPTNRSSSAARPSNASSRPTTSRATTPSRTRPSSTTTSIDRTIRPSQNSRPSTPTPRPQITANLTSPTIRPSSRPSTPTRRSPTPSLVPSSPSGGRALPSNGRISRPSSPVSRIRPPPQPIILPDFPHETPPNLRTTLPERPLSAGRSRPGAAMTVKGHVENTNSGSITRRQSSPIVNRGRLAEPPGRGRPHTNGNVVETLEARKTSHLPESLTRKPIKMSNSENGTGFGRSIRPLSGSTLFPQSIRSGNPRMQPGRASGGSVNGNYLENKAIPVVSVQHNRTSYSGKVAEVDVYESSRYDAMLLKEDLKNTSWLHSTDENKDQGPFFDNGFEPLPEPFGPL
ncbi:hypothetical protein Ccrd_018474 [Cynara cardunculus var. scolymus]|uniref:Uncharacterized protein n=1 Tax=Cynara cardunculus var. scolymus TaxID=59895 RepID=A0A103Y650_CYNCS|nr:hypothetical protein Ccrd_018474 [Cynara cardunculus var. scolymus]